MTHLCHHGEHAQLICGMSWRLKPCYVCHLLNNPTLGSVAAIIAHKLMNYGWNQAGPPAEESNLKHSGIHHGDFSIFLHMSYRGHFFLIFLRNIYVIFAQLERNRTQFERNLNAIWTQSERFTLFHVHSMGIHVRLSGSKNHSNWILFRNCANIGMLWFKYIASGLNIPQL